MDNETVSVTDIDPPKVKTLGELQAYLFDLAGDDMDEVDHAFRYCAEALRKFVPRETKD